jgi:hypothetical protein
MQEHFLGQQTFLGRAACPSMMQFANRASHSARCLAHSRSCRRSGTFAAPLSSFTKMMWKYLQLGGYRTQLVLKTPSTDIDEGHGICSTEPQCATS